MSLFRKVADNIKDDSVNFINLTFQNMIEFLLMCEKHGLTTNNMNSTFHFYLT